MTSPQPTRPVPPAKPLTDKQRDFLKDYPRRGPSK
jgi:hypothetical protein